jgi:hypothetical protein
MADDPYVWRDASAEADLSAALWDMVRAQQDVIQAQGDELRRLAMRIPPGVYVDHIDGDPLNNDPANLRLVNPRENRRG